MTARALILLCFFFSGATSIIYQHLWVRFLGFGLGNSYHSITIVISVFMGGLALGGFLGGRFSARIRNPLRIYGLLALGVAVFSVTVPWWIDLVSTWSIWSGQFQDSRPMSTSFLLASGGTYMLIFLVPTTLMGAMFPVLSAYFTRSLKSYKKV